MERGFQGMGKDEKGREEDWEMDEKNLSKKTYSLQLEEAFKADSEVG